MKIFKKDKMRDRLKREGRLDQIDAESEKMMEALDGLQAMPNLWQQTVHMDETAYYVEFQGQQIPVNGLDCEDV